jgi:hypothetical protein
VPTRTGRIPSKVYFTDDNAKRSRARATSLGLRLSTYLAILLRNAVYRGEPIVDGLDPATAVDPQVRAEIPLSLPASLHADATSFAARRSGTISRLLETLVEADPTDRPLIVWPKR